MIYLSWVNKKPSPRRPGGLPFSLLALSGGLLLLFAGCAGAGAGSELPSAPAHMAGVALDSSSIGGWASEVLTYNRGSDATGYSDTEKAIGPASGVATEVLVLGRGGSVTLTFEAPIADQQGAELAIFENGLGTADDLFAELAYVEVSSNGSDFVRFPASSSRGEPVGAYDRIDSANYSGFAGLYPKGVGTAFDLAQLSEEPEVIGGVVDLTSIRYVRLIDVIGDGSQSDPAGNPIYDPYPTTGTAGFDLDGVAFLQGGV